MNRKSTLFTVVAFGIVACTTYARAATIVTMSGPAVIPPTIVNPAQSVGWSMNAAFTGVAVYASLSSPLYGAGNGTAYLTTQVGAATEPGEHEVARANYAVVGRDPVSTLLFANLDLGPGTYFLTLSPNPFSSLGTWWTLTAAPQIDAWPGAAHLGSFLPEQDIWSGYPPALVSAAGFNLVYSVTGTPIPEPAVFAPTLAVLCCLTVFGVYSRRGGSTLDK